MTKRVISERWKGCFASVSAFALAATITLLGAGTAHAQQGGAIPVVFASHMTGYAASFEAEVKSYIDRRPDFSVVSERSHETPHVVVSTAGIHADQQRITALSLSFSIAMPGDEFYRFINSELLMCGMNQYASCARSVQPTLVYLEAQLR